VATQFLDQLQLQAVVTAAVELALAVKLEEQAALEVVEILLAVRLVRETLQFKVLQVVLDILEQTLIAVAVAVAVLQKSERRVLLDRAAKVAMAYPQV
tara:strand:- start:137 stop:430 length:294 start_codon:yes stop_codon:yes gene_type:complete